jgi:hypothetical protein
MNLLSAQNFSIAIGTPYIKKGNHNRLLFDDNGISIFTLVKQYKDDGLTLPDIIKKVDSELKKTNGGGNSKKKSVNNNHWLEKYLQEKDKRIKERDERESRLIELEKKLQNFKNELKLLPMGMTPEQVKIEWEREQIIKTQEEEKKRERIIIINKIEKIGILNYFLKKRKLIKKLKELDNHINLTKK